MVLSLVGCADHQPSPDPGALPVCTPTEMLDGEPAVWGWADLHTHPATELAFEERLIWGSALQHVDVISPNVLPAIDPPCSVETHHRDSSSPLDRTAHSQIMALLNQQAQYLHAPIGTITPRAAHLSAWPNGRDVLHQEMQLSSLRRAYEGGQRVLFASTTDSQVLAQLLKGPLFPDLFLPTSTYDEDSAIRQLDRIREMVSEQSHWMEIADSPASARRIIEAGRMAVILSLEMDSLSSAAVLRMIDRGVRHVIPVHLIDNAQGGTAANGDIFDSESAYMSELFDPNQRLRFFEVERTPSILFQLPRPILGASGPAPLPIYADLQPIPYDWYQRLAYEDTCMCSALSAPTLHAWDDMGHANRRGLSADGRALVRTLLERGVMVDVSHMGVHSTEDALCIAAEVNRPLLASHGGVGAATGPIGSERELDHGQAVRLANGGGILGLGTGGEFHEQTLFTQSAGTLVTLHTVRHGPRVVSEACVESTWFGASDASCARPLAITSPRDGIPIEHIEVRVTAPTGSRCTTSTARWFAQISLTRPGRPCGTSVPTTVQALFAAQADGSCVARVAMPVAVIDAAGPPLCSSATVDRHYDASDICSVDLSEIDPATCQAGGTPVPIATASASVIDTSGTTHMLASASGTPTWTSGGASLYVRTEVDPRLDDASMIRIGLSLIGPEIPSAAPSSDGYDVCVRPRVCAGDPSSCSCTPLTFTTNDTDCGAGWLSLDHRGDWPRDGLVQLYLTLPSGVRAGEICGLDLALLGDGPPITPTFDVATIESIHDPISLWAAGYDAIEQDLFAGEPGRIAFGTDMNGLATQFATAFSSPTDVMLAAHGCATPHLTQMSVDRQPLRLEDRGLGTYGMLTDVLATIDAHPTPDLDAATARRVIDSMFFSAEQVLRFWERVQGSRPTPPTPRCSP